MEGHRMNIIVSLLAVTGATVIAVILLGGLAGLYTRPRPRRRYYR